MLLGHPCSPCVRSRLANLAIPQRPGEQDDGGGIEEAVPDEAHLLELHGQERRPEDGPAHDAQDVEDLRADLYKQRRASVDQHTLEYSVHYSVTKTQLNTLDSTKEVNN